MNPFLGYLGDTQPIKSSDCIRYFKCKWRCKKIRVLKHEKHLNIAIKITKTTQGLRFFRTSYPYIFYSYASSQYLFLLSQLRLIIIFHLLHPFINLYKLLNFFQCLMNLKRSNVNKSLETDGRTDRWMGRRTNGRMNKCMEKFKC